MDSEPLAPPVVVRTSPVFVPMQHRSLVRRRVRRRRMALPFAGAIRFVMIVLGGLIGLGIGAVVAGHINGESPEAVARRVAGIVGVPLPN